MRDVGVSSLYEKHRALLTTSERVIAPGGCALVFYTHHRPHLAQRDMEFFDIARENEWVCEKVLTERFPVRSSCHSEVSRTLTCRLVRDQPMFPEDPGEEEVRSTVHGWKLARS